MSKDHGFKTIKSKQIYKGRILSVFDEEVRFPDGRTFPREIIRHSGAIGTVPLTADKDVLLVKQYRHPLGEEILEIPAGLPSENEDPADCASRELKEETGATSDEIVKLTDFYTTPGYSDEIFHLYLALNVIEGDNALEDDEVLEVVKLPLSKALERVKKGQIKDGKTVIGLVFAGEFIEKKSKRR